MGGTSTENLFAVIQTNDGGYLLGGRSSSDASGDKSQNAIGVYDYWIVKLDGSGNIQWDKTFGGAGNDELYSVIQTNDGGYLLGGFSVSNVSGDKSQNSIGSSDYWIVKLDNIGNKQWDKTLGGINTEYLTSITLASDGGYLLGGYSISNASEDKSQNAIGQEDYWVVKLDASGNKQWDKTIGGNNLDILISVVQTSSDGGYLLGGISYSNVSGDKSQNAIGGGGDYWVVKLDGNGNKQWDKTVGGTLNDLFGSLIHTSDDGYLLGGQSFSNVSGDKSQNSEVGSDYWVVKLDGSGNIQWDKTIGGSENESFGSLVQTNDGGYLLGGGSSSDASGDKSQNTVGGSDYWVVKLDGSGNIQWDKTVGGTSTDHITSLVHTSDGGYLLGGTSTSNASGDKSQNSIGIGDYWVVKLDSNNDQDPNPPSSPTLSLEQLSETWISLTWTESIDEVGVVSYDIFNGTELIGVTTELSFTATSLSPCTDYQFTVQARDEAGNTSTSNVVYTTTTDETPPLTPTLTDVTGCSVTLTPPTSTDLCVGEITGTTTDPLTYDVPGTYTVIWSFDDGNGNISTATQNIVITPGAEVTLTPFEAVCPGTPAFALTGGMPEGGTYSGDFVTDGMFNPIASGPGSFIIEYSVENELGCISTASQFLTVGTGGPAQLVFDDIFEAMESGIEGQSFEQSIPEGNGVLTFPENALHFNGVKQFQDDQSGNELSFNLIVTDIALDFDLELTVELIPGLPLTENLRGLATLASITAYAEYTIASDGSLSLVGDPQLEIGNVDLSFQDGGLYGIVLGLLEPFFVDLIVSESESTLLTWMNSPPFTLETIQEPQAVFSAQPSGCQGQEFQFLDESVVSSTAMYYWDFGDGQSSEITGNVSHLYEEAGEFLVTLTITDGSCEHSFTQTITVIPSPEVSLAPFDEICPGTPAFPLTGGTPEGGTYSGDFVIDGVFDPVSAGIGSFIITYSFTDGNGCENHITQTLVVGDDTPPVVVTQNLSIALDANGEATITAEQVDNGSSDNCAIASLALDQTLFTCENVGENTVTLTVTDANGNEASNTAIVTVTDDLPPQITPPADIIVGNDPEICGAVVDLGAPATSDNCEGQETTNDAPSTFDVGSTTVTWFVVDVHGNENTATQMVEVTNDAPVLGDIVAPIDPVEIGTTIQVSAPFTDNNLSAATWDWGDGNSSEGQIGESNITGSHNYSAPGVYILHLTLTDACGEQATTTLQFVNVFNSSGGFVTGIGWINSPAGTAVNTPNADGKATFGFAAKYQRKTHEPVGLTLFKFRAGDIRFGSWRNEWLIIHGHKALLKGEGRLENSSSTFGFLIAAIDGDMPGGGGHDKFRIKIWDKATQEVVYDNQMGDPDEADPTMEIGGGFILIEDGNSQNAREMTASNYITKAFEQAEDDVVENSHSGVGFELNIYPNPVVDHTLHLACSSESEGRGLVRIIDLNGRVLITQEMGIVPGMNPMSLDATLLPSGQYVVHFEMDGVSVRQKVIKY